MTLDAAIERKVRASFARQGFMATLNAELVDVTQGHVTITAPSAELLVQLTRHLVESGLAASGNIVEGARSVYRWEDEVHEANEAVASLRTQARHVEAIVETLRAEGFTVKTSSDV